MFFLLVLMFSSVSNDTHKLGRSHEDVLINDVNNPFTQNQIERISSLKVYDENMVDWSDYIILVEDNYKNNENKEGMFKQTYRLNIDKYDVTYVLTIYNVDFNKFDLIEILKVETKKGVFIDDRSILYQIINNLNIKVYKYELTDNNYNSNSKEGKYYQSYTITTTNRERINVLVEINVVASSNNLPKIITGVLTISLCSVITVTIIKKIRRKKYV